MLLLSIIAGSLSHSLSPTLPTASAGGCGDSDGDGMPDDWEEDHALNPDYPSDAWYDLDRDGYRNLAEYIHGTDPRNSTDFPDIADENDTDVDGVCNFGEYLAGTNWTDALSVPGSNDTDGDGLSDAFELGFGDRNSTNYTLEMDLNPCDPDTDHDGYQDDRVDNDGNPADGIKDADHTVGVDESWMDYDDDHFIEGFNDGVEVKLGSNPLIPNTWEAFYYGYNFYPGEASYEGRGLHRYLGGGGDVDYTAPELASGHSLTEYIREIKNNLIGETTIDPATCEATARDGWILTQQNYRESIDIDPEVPYPYEMYYNLWDGTLRLYARHQDSKDSHDYGKIVMKDVDFSRPMFLNNGIKSETILDYKDVYAGSDNDDHQGLISGRYFFSDFHLNYVETEKNVNDYFYLKIHGLEKVTGQGVYSLRGVVDGTEETYTEWEKTVYTVGVGASVGLEVNSKGEVSAGPSVGISGSKSFEEGSATTERKWSIDVRINGNSFFEAFSEAPVMNSEKVFLFPELRLWDFNNNEWGETIETYHKQLGLYRVETEGYNPGNYYPTSSSTHAVFALGGDGETEAGTIYYPAIPSSGDNQFYRNEEQFRIKVIINPDYLAQIYTSTLKAKITATLLDYVAINPIFEPDISWFYTSTTPNDYYSGVSFGEPVETSLGMDVPLYYESKEKSNVFLFANTAPSYTPIAYQIPECADAHHIHLIYMVRLSFKKWDYGTYMVDSSDDNFHVQTEITGCLVEKQVTGLGVDATENTPEKIDDSCMILAWRAWKYELKMEYINVQAGALLNPAGDKDPLYEFDAQLGWPPVSARKNPEDVYFNYDIEIKGPSIIAGDGSEQGILFTGRAPGEGHWEIEASDGAKTLNYKFLTTPYLYEDDLTINEIHLWDYDKSNADDSLGYPQEEYPEGDNVYDWERVPIEIGSSDFVNDIYTSPELKCYEAGEAAMKDMFVVTAKLELEIVRQPKILYGLDPRLSYNEGVNIICFDHDKEIFPDEFASYPVTLFNFDSKAARMYLRPMNGDNEYRSRTSAIWHTFFETGDSTVDFYWLYPSIGYYIELKPYEAKEITAVVGGWETNRLNGFDGGIYPGDSVIHTMVLDIDDGDEIIHKSTGFATTVIGNYGIDISCNRNMQKASITNPAEYDIKVTNTGDMSEKYELSYQYVGSGALPPGWSAEFEKDGVLVGPTAIGILEAGESTTYTLKVEAANLVAMQEKELRIKIISQVLYAYRANGETLEWVDCTDELITVTHTPGPLITWNDMKDFIAYSKDLGSYVIKRKLTHVSGDTWKDPATDEEFDYYNSDNKWISDKTSEEFNLYSDDPANVWKGESESRLIRDGKPSNPGTEFWIELTMPTVNIDPDEGTIVKQFLQDISGGGSYYDPYTGFTFTINPTSPRTMTVEDKDDNERGTLAETDPGIFTGNIDLDGDESQETAVTVDTTKTPPTVEYKTPNPDYPDPPEDPPDIEPFPEPVFPTYGVKVKSEVSEYVFGGGGAGVFYPMYIYNEADSGNPNVDNSVILDTMSIYYGFKFSELSQYLDEVSGVQLSELFDKTIYIRASPDILYHMEDSSTGTIGEIRFETVRGDGLADISDGEDTWAQDIFTVIPYVIYGVLDDSWDFVYRAELIALSDSSILVDGNGVTPFTISFRPIVHKDRTFLFTNGEGSPLLDCIIINNEDDVAKDSALFHRCVYYNEYLTPDQKDTIMDYINDYVGESWVQPSSLSTQESFEDVALTNPVDNDKIIRAGQSTCYSFSATYPETPSNQLEAQIPIFLDPPAQTTIYWDVSGLPNSWETLILGEFNTPVKKTFIRNGETINLNLQIIASDTAVAGETHTITVTAKDSEGYEYDSFEVQVSVIVAELVNQNREYADEYIVAKGPITVNNGGVLTYDNTGLVFDGSGLPLTVNNGGELIIRDSVIMSSNPLTQYTIVINEGGKLTIENSIIYDVNNGIQLLTSGDEMVTIKYSKISRFTTKGISISAGTPYIFSNKIIGSGSENGISISGGSPLIESNYISDVGIGIAVINSGANPQPSVQGNVIKQFTVIGIQLQSNIGTLTGATISNNFIISDISGTKGISANNFDGEILFNIIGCDQGVGISLEDTSMDIVGCDLMISQIGIVTSSTYPSTIELIDSYTTYSLALGSSLTTKWPLTVYVKDQDGNPVDDANVKVINTLGEEEFNGDTITNDYGEGYIVAYVKEKTIGTGGIETDFNPHNIEVTKDGYDPATITDQDITQPTAIDVTIQNTGAPA